MVKVYSLTDKLLPICLCARHSGSVGIMAGAITGGNGLPQYTIAPSRHSGGIPVVVGTGCGCGGVVDARKWGVWCDVGPQRWCSGVGTTARSPARAVTVGSGR